MCGICGIINFGNQAINESPVREMMQAMKHRGPDDEGIFIEDSIALGFVRLSIIDLTSTGHQPMLSDDGRYVIVYNGEIYNFIELRQELVSKGYVFKGNSDSEVLLKSYIEWGEACLNRLNGMWAFAIYDKLTKKTFAARDRYGVKPFYYYSDGSQFIFASEIPPILKVLKHKQRPNDQVIFDFLVFNRTDQTEETFFEGIKKLKHGCQLSIDKNQLTIAKWYDLRSNLKEPPCSPHHYQKMLSDSLKFRLRSDVPLGVCFSGGLDSSSIVSILLRDFNLNKLNTFSAVYGKAQQGDESDFINLYKPVISNMHFILPTAKSLYDDLHSFIKAHAEPFPDTSPYAQYKVMEIARQNAVVTLDGQGADEQLAGYHYFFGQYYKSLLLSGRIFRLISEISAYFYKHHSFYAVKTLFFYLFSGKTQTKVQTKRRGYINRAFAEKHKANNKVSENIYGAKYLHDALFDHFEYKLEHLLKWEDRNSMWFSLEARVPFLDHRLVESTLSLKSSDLIRNGSTKFYLREAMKGVIPEKIRQRKDKIGFATPEAEWFRTDFFKNFILLLLNSDSFKKRGYVDHNKCLDLYKKHLNGKINISGEIWKWVNLELWFREFID
jgi:asparagine synthase (glutamine-hydrolysing)